MRTEPTLEEMQEMDRNATVLETRTVGTYRIRFRRNPFHGILTDERRFDIEVLTADGTRDHFEQLSSDRNVAKKLDALVRHYGD